LELLLGLLLLGLQRGCLKGILQLCWLCVEVQATEKIGLLLRDAHVHVGEDVTRLSGKRLDWCREVSNVVLRLLIHEVKSTQGILCWLLLGRLLRELLLWGLGHAEVPEDICWLLLRWRGLLGDSWPTCHKVEEVILRLLLSGLGGLCL